VLFRVELWRELVADVAVMALRGWARFPLMYWMYSLMWLRMRRARSCCRAPHALTLRMPAGRDVRGLVRKEFERDFDEFVRTIHHIPDKKRGNILYYIIYMP
jgi:hypothetical protein